MIYCVEDDSSIRDLMVYTLNVSGFEAEGMTDAAELYSALERRRPQLIMLDIMLPGEDGISVLKHLRESGAYRDIPVIMATAKGTEYDKVIGLDLGADDYLAKPFGMMEMVSRIKAVLRRVNPDKEENCLRVGELELNLSGHTVTAAGERVSLTLKEYCSWRTRGECSRENSFSPKSGRLISSAKRGPWTSTWARFARS